MLTAEEQAYLERARAQRAVRAAGQRKVTESLVCERRLPMVTRIRT